MKQLASSLHVVRNSQLASLLTTRNRLVIIKPERAMRTHPDIGLAIADLLQLARFWLCTMQLMNETTFLFLAYRRRRGYYRVPYSRQRTTYQGYRNTPKSNVYNQLSGSIVNQLLKLMKHVLSYYDKTCFISFRIL